MLNVRIGKRLTCKRCGYAWHARKTEIKICPRCKSKLFDVPRKLKGQMSA